MTSDKKRLHVLVLEPFGGGSHSTFYRGWSKYSQHRFTVCELPANHWKWRSRHAAFSFARQVASLGDDGPLPDVVFCSSMLELPVWRGLVNERLARLPAIAYFHENQFTYPLSEQEQRDYHYAYSNALTAISAQQVWFNSRFHCLEFYAAARNWLRKMPDGKQHLKLLDEAETRSFVRPPGFEIPAEVVQSQPANASSDPIPVIGWVARWEHDKAPERFVQAIGHLARREVDFQLCLLGERFRSSHPALSEIEELAAGRILFSGYAENSQTYWQQLASMDLVVSTARHEFFGIAMVEAMAAGALPVVPNALAYPEVLQLADYPQRSEYFYNRTANVLQADSLEQTLERHLANGRRRTRSNLVDRAREFLWQNIATNYDKDLEDLVG